jgi:hypothetical protein
MYPLLVNIFNNLKGVNFNLLNIMAIVSVEDNIKGLQQQITEMSREIHRLEGMLRVFMEFQKNGLKEVDLPGALPKDENDQESED